MQELTNFPGINIQSLSQYILLLMLSTLRIGSFLLSSPFFGSRMIPLPVRIVFSFSLGIWFLNNLKFPYIETLQGIDLVPIIFQEISIGLICGMILSICFGAVILAGEKIGRLR